MLGLVSVRRFIDLRTRKKIKAREVLNTQSIKGTQYLTAEKYNQGSEYIYSDKLVKETSTLSAKK